MNLPSDLDIKPLPMDFELTTHQPILLVIIGLMARQASYQIRWFVLTIPLA